MNKHFDPIISEEKLAAWLDGMLPADEMQQLSALMADDSDMQALLQIADDLPTDTLLYNDPMSETTFNNIYPMQDFALPELVQSPTPFEPLNPTDIAPTFLPDEMMFQSPTDETLTRDTNSIDDNLFNTNLGDDSLMNDM